LSQIQPFPAPEHFDQPPRHSGLAAFLFVLRCLGAEIDDLQESSAALDGDFGVADMLSAARALGYEAWAQTCDWEKLGTVPFPALAELKDGHFLILGAYAHDRVLLQDPHRGAHASGLTREQFAAIWSGRLVLLTTAGMAP
jgi:ATP-binding cassette, subfamily B, bacterial HlyB/CyaB